MIPTKRMGFKKIVLTTIQAITSAHLPRIRVSNAAAVDTALTPLRNLLKTSGIYVVFSMISPLISLFLSPFLTHQFTTTDYGILTTLNIMVTLTAGLAQLGLPSAFFRAYNYDYTESKDKRAVVVTATILLFLISVPVAIGVIFLSPFLARLIFGMSALSHLIAIAGILIVLQNLSTPGFAWLRAQNRALFYSLLALGNLFAIVIANIVLVAGLHWGITGAFIAGGCGPAFVVLCTIPVIIFRAGIRLRPDIARSMISFGAPLVFTVISSWVLQVSDRYLLGVFHNFGETAQYSIAYTLGTGMNTVLIAPFTLAWPTAMFTIAKRGDAPYVFQGVFRWFGLLALFVVFGISFLGTLLLDWLYPAAYHSAAPVIPVVALSLAFYGIYFILMVGANVKRKTWFSSIFVTIAAIVNFILNLILIPPYGMMGSAVATFIAYILLAVLAYIINERIYPIPFQIHVFMSALVLGAFFYIGNLLLGRNLNTWLAWGLAITFLGLYGACLLWFARPFSLSQKKPQPIHHAIKS